MTYDACSPTDTKYRLIGSCIVGERGVKGSLRPVHQINFIQANKHPDCKRVHTGSNKLITLKLSKQALICVTVLL